MSQESPREEESVDLNPEEEAELVRVTERLQEINARVIATGAGRTVLSPEDEAERDELVRIQTLLYSKKKFGDELPSAEAVAEYAEYAKKLVGGQE